MLTGAWKNKRAYEVIRRTLRGELEDIWREKENTITKIYKTWQRGKKKNTEITSDINNEI